MNMFHAYFGQTSDIKSVEFDGVKFELKEFSETTPKEVLWFNGNDFEKIGVIESHVRRIAPFLKNSVACELRMPRGDRNIRLFFYEDGRLWDEDGYIKDRNHLIYMYKNEMHICNSLSDDRIIFDESALRRMGYLKKIYFEEDKFMVKTEKDELVPYNFYNYEGDSLESLKKEKIAREIMLYIQMYICKEFSKESQDAKRHNEILGLSWNAKTVTLAGPKRLLELDAQEDNLEEPNAGKFKEVIELFEVCGKSELFPRYMELLCTAYEVLSRKNERIFAKWFLKKEKTDELQLLET
ncbi:MAG: hypothetical protein J6V50_03135, partial [Clostridia bacterium]|nr:hypothetical protein [Clostridia bacterium]